MGRKLGATISFGKPRSTRFIVVSKAFEVHLPWKTGRPGAFSQQKSPGWPARASLWEL